MIIYELSCTDGHRFEGWFASAGDFERQSQAELVRCPLCNDGQIAIVPAAKVAVTRSAAGHADREPTAVQGSAFAGPAAPMVAGLPPELVRKLRALVLATENVGSRFPEEARRIHYAETPPRPIRGEASASDAEALRDEGIEFTALPAFLARESH